MKHLILIISTFIVLTVGQNANDDSILTNFTAEVTEITGPCHIPSAKLLAKKHSQYEGRWYGVYVGFTEKQAKTISCLCWDLLFDKDGTFQLFFYLKENGIFKVIHAKDTPISAKNGIYRVDLIGDGGPPVFFSTLYYINNGILSLWDGDCKNDKTPHYQELITGIRDIPSKTFKSAEIEQIYASISDDGIPSEKHEIKHENCDYPPKIKHRM